MSICVEQEHDLTSSSISLSEVEALRVLASGAIHEQGLLPYSSNYSFLVTVGNSDLPPDDNGNGAAESQDIQISTIAAVYKPQRGENPLWDFQWGTLYLREVAAYEVSRHLSWHLVPPTVLREGPHGIGSVQLYIQNDEAGHYFAITASARHEEELRRVALFDFIINNADRKSGHCLIDYDHRLWAIDHGIAFHAEYKLRTVIWEFSGQPIAEDLLADLLAFDDQLESTHTPESEHLSSLLNQEELAALRERVRFLMQTQRYPIPDESRRNFPWPPI